MPRISLFYGIAIWMYWNEGAHARPHFHARYAGQSASIDVTGELIAGTLPRRALTLVAERDPAHFARVKVDPEAGTITWPDGLDMAPQPLYEEARRHPAELTQAAI